MADEQNGWLEIVSEPTPRGVAAPPVERFASIFPWIRSLSLPAWHDGSSRSDRERLRRSGERPAEALPGKHEAPARAEALCLVRRQRVR